MKKTIITLSAAALAVVGANAQGLVAGWDFADVSNLSNAVNGYGAEKTAFNNGVSTSGSIYVDGSNGSSSLTQGTQVFFSANGAQASAPGFSDGFDQTASDLFGGLETGQQSLNFDETGGAFNVTFGFTRSTDVVFNMDWLNESSSVITDIMNVSFSNDGINWTHYAHPSNGDGQYWAGASTTAWAQSTSNAGGLAPAFGAGQSDMTIDLTGLGEVSNVRLEFAGVGANERIGLDNVHIAGSAVPEPSAYAAVVGALALAFVAVRRRK